MKIENPDIVLLASAGNKRKLAFTKSFRALLAKGGKGICIEVLALAKQAVEEYDPAPLKVGVVTMEWDKGAEQWFEVIKRGKKLVDKSPATLGRGIFLSPGKSFTNQTGTIHLTLLGVSNIQRFPLYSFRVFSNRSNYFHIKILFDGEVVELFAKQSFQSTNSGYTEFCGSRLARHLLRPFKDVTVSEPLLGWQSASESWFVSAWQELTAPNWFASGSLYMHDDYGQYPEAAFDQMSGVDEECTHFEEYRGEIEKVLRRAELIDLGANLFYSPYTHKFILIDATYGLSAEECIVHLSVFE